MNNWVVWRDPFGTQLTELGEFVKLEYMRTECRDGWLQLDLDPSQLIKDYLRLDCKLEPWRQVGGNAPYIDGETSYLLRKWGYITDSVGRRVWRLYAYDPLYLLKGVPCLYAADHQKAIISSQAADDAMKTIVKENRGSECDYSAWDLTTYLKVQANKSLCATLVEFRYSRQMLLNILQRISAWSFSQGTYLAFDIVPSSPAQYEFRTYTKVRGIDRSFGTDNQLILSESAGNLEQVQEWDDHTEEYNDNFAGCGANNEIFVEDVDTAAVGQSPYNRRGMWVPSSGDSTDVITAEVKAATKEHRAKKIFSAKVKDTEGCLYGVHYRWGDLVFAQGELSGYNAHIDSVHITVEKGAETREIQIKAEA